MYEEFKNEKLMGDSDYAPFNEAMCVNPLLQKFLMTILLKQKSGRTQQFRRKLYKKVIDPLRKLFTKKYKCIVLWFGEDMFCQMNLLTILSYLEQSYYEGKYINTAQRG